MAIRKGTWLDWSRINEIFRQELPIVPDAERHYVIQARLEGTWVWEAEGKVWAFAMMDDTKFQSASWLDYLAVAKPYKGYGIGKLLMAHCEAEGRRQGKNVMALSTFRSNLHAVGFYRSLGYRERPDTIDGKILFTKSFDGLDNDPLLIPLEFNPNRLKMRFRRLLFDCIA